MQSDADNHILKKNKTINNSIIPKFKNKLYFTQQLVTKGIKITASQQNYFFPQLVY